MVKNERSYISSPTVFLHGVDRGNFTFTFALARKCPATISHTCILVVLSSSMEEGNKTPFHI
jgi:hypothetical protein